mmetsp:Transcript_1305/g.2995  ORF Transcript_1305/g.2995 Transcript_1305/m.2995 type:complete len:227 (+) Transcript_1305:282-962(+)
MCARVYGCYNARVCVRLSWLLRPMQTIHIYHSARMRFSPRLMRHSRTPPSNRSGSSASERPSMTNARSSTSERERGLTALRMCLAIADTSTSMSTSMYPSPVYCACFIALATIAGLLPTVLRTNQPPPSAMLGTILSRPGRLSRRPPLVHLESSPSKARRSRASTPSSLVSTRSKSSTRCSLGEPGSCTTRRRQGGASRGRGGSGWLAATWCSFSTDGMMSTVRSE